MSAKVKVDIYKYKGASPILIDEGVDVTFKQLQNFIDSTVYRVLYSDDGTVATEDNIMDKFYGGGGAADAVSYDNTESGLTAENVQSAIDEVAQGGGGGGGSDNMWVIYADDTNINPEGCIYTGEHPTFEEFAAAIKSGKWKLTVITTIDGGESFTRYWNHESAAIDFWDNGDDTSSIEWYTAATAGEGDTGLLAKITPDNVMKVYYSTMG